MAKINKIQLYRSSTSSAVPVLVYGELGINVTDKKLYYGNASASTTDIMEVITKATTSVPGKASFASADFAVSGAAAVTISSVSNTQLAGSIEDSKLLEITTADKVSLTALNINGATDIGAALVSGDLIAVDDGAGGTNRKSTIDRLATLFAGNGLAVSGATLAVGVDGSTIEINLDVLRVKEDGIDSAHYAPASIDTEHIGNLQITTALIDNNAITTGKIQDGTIQSSDLKQTDEGEAVTTATIRAGAVTTTEIGPDAVTSAKIGDDEVTNDHLAANAVGTTQIADNAVTGDKLADSITIASNLTVTGDLTVSGASTIVNTTTLSVEDTFIELNRQVESAESTSNIEDTRDIGFYAAYDSVTAAGTDLYLYTGLGRDASEKKWVLFQELDTEPSSSPGAVAMGGNTSRTAKLQVNIEGLANLTNTIEYMKIDCGTF